MLLLSWLCLGVGVGVVIDCFRLSFRFLLSTCFVFVVGGVAFRFSVPRCTAAGEGFYRLAVRWSLAGTSSTRYGIFVLRIMVTFVICLDKGIVFDC